LIKWAKICPGYLATLHLTNFFSKLIRKINTARNSVANGGKLKKNQNWASVENRDPHRIIVLKIQDSAWCALIGQSKRNASWLNFPRVRRIPDLYKAKMGS
jgi:hypothetical protein